MILSYLILSYLKLSEAKHCGEAREGVGDGGVRSPPPRFPSSRFRTFPGAVRASDLSKKTENKTTEILIHAAFNVDAPRIKILHKCKNNPTPDF